MKPIKMRRIAAYNLPAKLPILGSVVLWLVLDRLAPPLWLAVIAWILWAVYVVGIVLFMVYTERVDVVDTFDPYGGRVLTFSDGALAGQRVVIGYRDDEPVDRTNATAEVAVPDQVRHDG